MTKSQRAVYLMRYAVKVMYEGELDRDTMASVSLLKKIESGEFILKVIAKKSKTTTKVIK